MGLTGMVFSTIAIAAGAVMYWAVTTQGHGFRSRSRVPAFHGGGHPHGRRSSRTGRLDDRLRHVPSSDRQSESHLRQASDRPSGPHG